MVKTYSAHEMLALWRLMRGYEPLRTDCLVTRTDGVDIDALLRHEIDMWYSRMLDTAPPAKLSVTDYTSLLVPTRAPDGAASVARPTGCRRVVEVVMEGWEREGLLVTDPTSGIARAQSSPYARGGCVDPVVLVGRNTIRLYTPPADVCRIVTFTGIAEPVAGVYRFDEGMLPFDSFDQC